jgi:hypothetical protein
MEPRLIDMVVTPGGDMVSNVKSMPRRTESSAMALGNA